ncbi:MAG: B12-binding domain-containing radical SAM protein, partial [Nitrospirota bacterium]
MKISLIFPKKDGDPGAMGMTMPYVLPHLAALSQPWHEIELINLFKQKEDYGGRLPDLVGISVMTPMAQEAYRVADEYRKRGVKVVIGGHHASAMPHEAKRHSDAVAIGEAEDTWKIILDDAEIDSLKDFYIGGPLYSEGHFSGSSVYHSPDRPSLAGLPLPRRDLLKGRYFFDCVITTRGCPYRCKFCGTSRFYGGAIRHRPVEEVTDEIKQMGRFFLMADDDIFGDVQYRLDLYSKMNGLRRFMRWHGAGAVSAVLERSGEEMIKLAAKSGLDTVFTGLESAEGDTLDALEINAKLRRQERGSLEKITQAVK